MAQATKQKGNICELHHTVARSSWGSRGGGNLGAFTDPSSHSPHRSLLPGRPRLLRDRHTHAGDGRDRTGMGTAGRSAGPSVGSTSHGGLTAPDRAIVAPQSRTTASIVPSAFPPSRLFTNIKPRWRLFRSESLT
jgi:hypothetical protein